jgi:hypothetical protein
MRNSIILPVVLTAILFSIACSTKNTSKQSLPKVDVQVACVAFYNLENIFDTIDNPDVNDFEYTPAGPNKWGTMKYNAKLQRMSYAISQIGLDYSPVGAAVLGVCEVENKGVLEELVKQPDIRNRNYEVVLHEGPDRRGVDVGLIYNPALFVMTNSKSYRLVTADSTFRTRDQLMVSGYLLDEKIHFIVNHWPSRVGGEERSRPKRNEAARLTKSIVDSLYRVEPKAKIVVMGDMNDDPKDESVAVILGAKKNKEDVKPGELFNVFWRTHERGIGSLAYQDQWNLFDQIIISHELINKDKNKLYLWRSEVFNRPFLTQQEGQYKGTPLRTHAGGVWLNGYSDHYPTLIYLVKEK